MTNYIMGKTAITTSEISRRLGFSISAKFIAEVLEIPPRLSTGNANYWLDDDFRNICYELSQHTYGLQFVRQSPETIIQCEFTVRTNNCFRSMDIKTVKDLIKLTKYDLFAIPNFGKKCLAEVVDFLAGYDLKLKD